MTADGHAWFSTNAAIRTARQIIKSTIPRRAITYTLKAGSSKPLLLTFDDGPHETLTFRVLEALDKLGAKAVFFMVGSRIDGKEDVVREVAKAGHIIGNHSFSHSDFRGKSVTFLRQDLERCQSQLAGITGTQPRYFRPPFGRLTPSLWLAATGLGLRVMHWSNEGGEWGRNSASSSLEIATMLAGSMRTRQIVLFHDDCDRVVEVLGDPRFIDAISKFTVDGRTFRSL